MCLGGLIERTILVPMIREKIKGWNMNIYQILSWVVVGLSGGVLALQQHGATFLPDWTAQVMALLATIFAANSTGEKK